MAWTIIPDSDIDPDSPITTGLMTSYRNNIIESAPTGMIIDWPFDTVPSGFLFCDGSAISRSTYAALFAVAGVTYGNGDGSTTFNIPDRRGRFNRCWANGSANDPDRASRTDRGDATAGDSVGTNQGHQFYSHGHTVTGGNSINNGQSCFTYYSGDGFAVFGGVGTSGTGGNETRSINQSSKHCIRYTGN